MCVTRQIEGVIVLVAVYLVLKVGHVVVGIRLDRGEPVLVEAS